MTRSRHGGGFFRSPTWVEIMNPFLWILWAFVALVFVFIAAAVVYTVVEKFRELPPKRAGNGVSR